MFKNRICFYDYHAIGKLAVRSDIFAFLFKQLPINQQKKLSPFSWNDKTGKKNDFVPENLLITFEA